MNYLNTNDKKGITLIALVITIIVLIILAAVSLATLTGDNSLINRAIEARKNTAVQGTIEQIKLDIAEKQTSYITTQITEGQLKEILKRYGTINYEEDGTTIKSITTTKGKYEILLSEMQLGNIINNNAIGAGEKLQDLTNAEGNVIGDIISDGVGGEVPIPTGFYYVGGKVTTGVVISDNEADKDLYKGQVDVGTDLTGNQFVWVPVDGKILKYEQDHTYDSKHQYQYTDYDDWTDEGGDSTSVAQYGGFYIGRYEAGYPNTIVAGTIVASKDSATNKVPVSKAGVASWNLVSQTVAKTAAQSMYNEESKVKSRLVDSYAWDTTCKWLKNSGIITENSQGKIDSTNYGNYTNSTFTIKKDTLYSKHIYLTAKSGSGESSNWYYWKGGSGKYSYNTVEDKNGMQVGIKTNVTVPSDVTNKDNYTADERIEIATGSAETTKTNNIYDLAGNMWEWTTETGYRNDKTTYPAGFAVRRGGSFNNHGGNDSVVYRNGNNGVGYASVNFGFRVVLYIK